MLALLLACGPPPKEAAPDLESSMHLAWQTVETGTPEEWVALTNDLDALIGEEVVKGTLEDLSDAEQALVPLEDPIDIGLAQGLVFGGNLACGLDEVDPVLYALEQDEIFSGYSAYERDYTSDVDAYEARDVDTLTWHTVYSATVLNTYTAEIDARLRWMGSDPPVLVERAWMPTPSTFERGDDRFDQDYQLQVFWERDDGTTRFAYGMWRDLEYGGYTLENEGVQTLILNKLEDWAEELGEACVGAR